MVQEAARAKETIVVDQKQMTINGKGVADAGMQWPLHRISYCCLSDLGNSSGGSRCSWSYRGGSGSVTVDFGLSAVT